MSGCSTVRHGLSGLRAAQRSALAAPPTGPQVNATATQKNKCSYTAAGGVGYRRLLGRDMADDGRSDYQTVGTAETCGRQNGRDIRHAIRRRALRHATTIPDAVSGDRRYRTRRAQRDAIRRRGHPAATGLMRRRDRRRIIRHAMIISCPNMPGYARICPDMPGRCSVIPGDVWLTRLSGNRITGCERPNGSP